MLKYIYKVWFKKMENKLYKINLTEREIKVIKYCYDKANKTFKYEIQGNEILLPNCPELAMDEIINVLTSVYFADKKSNIKSTDAINELINKLFQLSNEYVEGFDFNQYLNSASTDKKDIK